LRYPLDERAVYAVHIGIDAPTTVMFPGPIDALDAAGISGKPDDQPPVLLSHQAGARFFSVRALRAGAAGAANVVFRDRVYAFAFTASGEPDRTVTFLEGEKAVGNSPSARSSAERLLILMDQAKNYAALVSQYPAIVQRIERTTPNTECVRGPVSAVIEEVLRFEDEDALVFRVRLENRGKNALRYAPGQLGVRVGETVFPVALTDAPGLLPAGRSTRIMLVVVGNPDGSRGGLSIKNSFSLAFPVRVPVE
jgi:hypothetical protein